MTAKPDKRTRTELIAALKAAERREAKLLKRIADHDATADALANVLIADTGDSAVHVTQAPVPFPWNHDAGGD